MFDPFLPPLNDQGNATYKYYTSCISLSASCVICAMYDVRWCWMNKHHTIPYHTSPKWAKAESLDIERTRSMLNQTITVANDAEILAKNFNCWVSYRGKFLSNFCLNLDVQSAPVMMRRSGFTKLIRVISYGRYLYKWGDLYLCSAKAPVLQGSGSRCVYRRKGTSFDRVYVCL